MTQLSFVVIGEKTMVAKLGWTSVGSLITNNLRESIISYMIIFWNSTANQRISDI